MDDQMNQGMPGGAVPPLASPAGGPPPPPPPAGPASPLGGEDPHSKILSALERIEQKLSAIAVKVGA